MSKGAIIGVLGAGQLGRMLALAGIPLGLRFRFFDTHADAPAGEVGELRVGEFRDTEALLEFSRGLTAATYEFENVPVAAAAAVASSVTLHPNLGALETAQDRLSEKQLFTSFGIPTPAFAPIASIDELNARLDSGFALPAVLKTRRLGYDGKGQAVIRERSEAAEGWRAIGEAPALLEGFVTFDAEVSLIGVRSASRELRFYPLVQNEHRDGILRRSIVPAPAATEELQARAERYLAAIMDHFDYVGVCTIEFFLQNGDLIANEIAPRVHNSGHWTIEGAVTSQFENHLRALIGLPLGSTAARGEVRMENIIGSFPDLGPVLEISGAHVHLYGKSPRPGRKLGHITYVERD